MHSMICAAEAAEAAGGKGQGRGRGGGGGRAVQACLLRWCVEELLPRQILENALEITLRNERGLRVIFAFAGGVNLSSAESSFIS